MKRPEAPALSELIRPDNISSDADFDPSAFGYNEKLGLYVGSGTVAIDGLKVVGFGAPFGREGGFNQAETVQPLVDFGQLPSKHKTPAKQGKGVGPRMYNTPQAVMGQPGELPDRLGAYTFDIDPNKILDLRERGKLETVLRHAWVIGSSIVPGGLERTVGRIHKAYGDEHKASGGEGDPQAVLRGQPPRAVARQTLQRGVRPPVPPVFMIIRDPDIELQRIGSYTQDDLREA